MMEMAAPLPKEGPGLQLRVEDITLVVPDGFQEETLERVLRVVRGC